LSFTLRQIEVFRSVMRARSIIGAARDLKIAQPTVTKTIRRIEDICGLVLFDRSGRQLTPVAEAHRLLAEVELAFGQLETAMARALHVARADLGTFRLGASPSVGRALVPLALRPLLQAHEGLSLHLDILSVSQIMDYLLAGQGEACVTLFPILHADIRSVQVGTCGPVALWPRELQPLGGDGSLPEDFAGHTLVVFEPQSVHGRVLGDVLKSGAVTPSRTHVVRFAETAVALAEAGIGVAIVDAFSASAADLSRINLRPIHHPARYHVYLHWHAERARSGLVQQLDASLRQVVDRFIRT
jgi:DNA-binding transcriptional LysR family regulator